MSSVCLILCRHQQLILVINLILVMMRALWLMLAQELCKATHHLPSSVTKASPHPERTDTPPSCVQHPEPFGSLSLSAGTWRWRTSSPSKGC